MRANSGRFGPYVQLGKLFASIPKGEDPMTIDLPRALELLTAKKDAEAKSHLKTFEEDKELEVRTGRFGPYIAWKGKNFKLPKKEATRAAELTYEECLAIVKAESQKKKK